MDIADAKIDIKNYIGSKKRKKYVQCPSCCYKSDYYDLHLPLLAIALSLGGDGCGRCSFVL